MTIHVKGHRRGKSIIKAYVRQAIRYSKATTNREQTLAWNARDRNKQELVHKAMTGVDLLKTSPNRYHGSAFGIAQRILKRRIRR